MAESIRLKKGQQIDATGVQDSQWGVTQREVNVLFGSDFAAVENGSAASTAYSAGKLIVFKGKLCKASTGIAAGTALAIGSNLTATTVEAEITAVKESLTTVTTQLNVENAFAEYRNNYGIVQIKDHSGNIVYFQIKTNGTFNVLNYNGQELHRWT